MGETYEESSISPDPSDDFGAFRDRLKWKQKYTTNDLRIGVSFRKFSCYGQAMSARYQSTFASYILAVPKFIGMLVRGASAQSVHILQDFEGLLHPGEMLLVLGRTGSGCSTFLKALAGETRGFYIGDDAEVNYQGIPYKRMHRSFKGERSYVTELDVHFPELTLGQTLNFAVSTRQRHPDPGEGYNVACLFGLEQAFVTRVGNAAIRGISGGEKRRTSMAEALIGGAQLQFWDNSTRGLDSSNARSFIRLLRDLTNVRQSTVAMSIYQASEDIYRNFDKVILLYEGRQIYFGPTEAATEYFTNLGFAKPSRATSADFLTSLTNPEERIIRDGYEHQVPRFPDEFANVWKQSQESKVLGAAIREFNSTHPIPKEHCAEKVIATEKLRLRTATYPLSLRMQVVICMHRSFRRLRNSPTPAISAIIANTVLGTILGSVFYNVPGSTDSLQQRSVLLFFGLLVNAFAPAFEVSLMWAQRPIVEKHDRYAFYHPFTERLASVITDLPIKLLVSFGLHIPLYFLTNLRRTASAFFTYWLFMFVNLVTMSMLFRTIGSISRTREQTLTPVLVLVLLCIIYAGYVVPPAYMVPWLAWFWRINPVAYTYESLMINELSDRLFPCSTTIPSGSAYSRVETSQKICAVVGSNVGQQNVQGTDYLKQKYGYLTSHLWRNFGVLFAMMILFCVTHLLAAEYVPAKPSRGEVLLFRRGTSRKKPSLQDEESGALTAISSYHGQEIKSRNNKAIVPIIPHQAVVFHWEKLSYEIETGDGSRIILNNIDGWVKPGTLTALMGVTGAGKTTLLDVLADRVTIGNVRGSISVEGHARDASFPRKIGYVQQDDIHLPTTTVREALQFSALLRQPKEVPTEEKLAYVEAMLKMMEMEQYAEAIVGVPGEGLNIEQRKRLTIAVEMVAKPEFLFFLDEPTSGLDSETAWSICTLLRKLANQGQAILCTIHQPSSQLFSMFDHVLLLDKGGTTLYFGDIGENAGSLISYFENNGARKCNPEDNPAEWMLEVTGNKPKDPSKHRVSEGNWTEIWRHSQQHQAIVEELARFKTSLPEKSDSPSRNGGAQYSAPLYKQALIVSRRILREHWRDPVYLYSRISPCVGHALVNGISFYNATLDIQGLTSLLFSIFLTMHLFSSISGLVIPRLANGHDLFEARERKSKSYSWIVFILVNVLVEMLWQTLIAVPIFAAWYYPTGLWRNGDGTFGIAERGALTFVFIWIFTLWTTTLSQALAAGMRQPETAVQVTVLFYWLSLVFCGVLVQPDLLPRFWIFMYYVSPLTYFVEGIAAAGLANTKIKCSDIELLRINLPQNFAARTCGEYLAPYIRDMGGYVVNPADQSGCQYCSVLDTNTVLRSLGINTQYIWRNVGIMVVYVCFNLLATFGLYWVAKVPRRRAQP